jgi:alkyl sulfatase BDS1-like metallo-beta-lactamase superfamily hydrolase
MHFLFPERRALCIAENANHNLHNIVTLRGALVRDPHGWASYLDEAISLSAEKSDVLFAQHHWPRWGPTASSTSSPNSAISTATFTTRRCG